MLMDKFQHVPVLLNESIEALRVKRGAYYIDCNLGGGGHTEKILQKGGRVIAFEVDEVAIEFCKQKFDAYLKKNDLLILSSNFSNIEVEINKIRSEFGREFNIAGILYDLGVSMFQFKYAGKGFSFEDTGGLDMRMDNKLNVKAIDLIRVLSETELALLLKKYGEDPQAFHFAKAIKSAVRKNPNISAKELADIIKISNKYKSSKNHPATRVFQALRIAVNSELSNLEASLSQATKILMPMGRLVIISFHSLEDKLAKNLIKSPGLRSISEVPIIPSEDEVSRNFSSRSAKLRIYEKI